jgi:hypothetical protein
MITSFVLVFASTLTAVPFGVEIDCKSWIEIRTKLKITVLATDGSTNVARIEFGRSNKQEDVQFGLVLALQEEGWVVKAGPDNTVLVFAPKGQSVKSITFDSTGWIPVYKRIPVPPDPEKPKAKNPGK